ncbi:hypothetical protein [Sporosarcina sp. P3]|uniref:hypothetical protein n=1 Tax=Sporosarcina sp. P3 TaxID=2048245 RepID=UPI00117B0D76|nr:hypothetical protein [Sporosarcina sp. P3]
MEYSNDAKNHQKQRIAITRIQEMIANKRKDYLHKLSNRVIGMENLHGINLLKDHKLAKVVSDMSWSPFRIIPTSSESGSSSTLRTNAVIVLANLL